MLKFDSAYIEFNNVITLNPKIQEAYYFKAFCFYYSIHQLGEKDTLNLHKLANELNLIVRITSDTNKLKLLAEAAYNLNNYLRHYSVFDGESEEKISGLINGEPYYFPMITSLFYELDSLPPPIINKSIYELFSHLNLHCFNPFTNSFEKKSIPFETLLLSKNIQTIIGLPDSLSLDSFIISIMKVTRGYKVEAGTIYKLSFHEVISLQSYSSKLTDEMVDALRQMTVYDKIYFENLYSPKVKNGFIPITIGRLFLSEM